MTYRPVSAIEVRCWEMRVGVVALDPVRGYYAFEYYPDFRFPQDMNPGFSK